MKTGKVWGILEWGYVRNPKKMYLEMDKFGRDKQVHITVDIRVFI